MREVIVVASVLAMLLGGSIGIAWRPWLSEYDNMVDDLLFLQMDIAALRKENQDLKRLASAKATERNRAVTDSEEWRHWSEQLHGKVAALEAALGEAKSDLASANLFRSAQAQELVELKAAAKTKVAKATASPLPKRKPRVKKRKPVRVVHRWPWF